MQIDTLIIGYVPLSDTAGKKPRELRDDKYFKELLSGFDLGTVHFVSRENYKTKIDELNPLVIISLGGDYYAEEVRQHKNSALLYATHDAGSVFYRKAETEEKKSKHIKVFSEIERIIKKIQNDGEKEVEAVRKFASMSYDDMYEMLKKAIAGDNKKLHDQAWDLLFGKGEKHSNFIWMRMQLLAEIWDLSDGKKREELMCMAMNQFVDEEMGRKLDDFTDEDGQQFHQYMFCDVFGRDLNYIRRIPYGEKGQDKYAYEALLDKYDTHSNYLRVMLEAGQLRSQKEEYFKTESEKVLKVLTAWKENPTLSKKELGVLPWVEGDSTDDPLTEREVQSMKNFLQKHDKENFDMLFANSE